MPAGSWGARGRRASISGRWCATLDFVGDAGLGLLRFGDPDGLASRGVGSGVVSRVVVLLGSTGTDVRGDVLRRLGAEDSIVAAVRPLSVFGALPSGFGARLGGGGVNWRIGSRITSWSRNSVRTIATSQVFIASRILPRVGPPPPSRPGTPPRTHSFRLKKRPAEMTSDIRDPTKIDVPLFLN